MATVNRDLGVANATKKTDHRHDAVQNHTTDDDDYPEVPGEYIDPDDGKPGFERSKCYENGSW